ncbi:MAG: hypothetical protein ACR2JB_08300 [Bryobacteraceae bacterium]
MQHTVTRGAFLALAFLVLTASAASIPKLEVVSSSATKAKVFNSGQKTIMATTLAVSCAGE